METKAKLLFCVTCFSLNTLVSQKSLQEITRLGENGNQSTCFTENKGQVVNQHGQPQPDVLFSAELDQLVVHLKEKGLSYQVNEAYMKKNLVLHDGSSKHPYSQWKTPADKPIRSKFPIHNDSVSRVVHRIDINWIGANQDYKIQKGEPSEGYNNYYLGQCPDGVTHVKSFRSVTYVDIYPGIDLKWYGSSEQGLLEYDYIVSPRTNYRNVKWEIQGAKSISIGQDGELIIETEISKIIELPPKAYQGDTEIEASWHLEENEVSFHLGEYNKDEILIIDPIVRVWGSYYGGSGQDWIHDCVSTGASLFASGTTYSTSTIATTGAHQATFIGGTTDAYLVKFSTAGVRLWSTYYGGSGEDDPYGCSTDGSNVYMTGMTYSTSGLSTTGSHQSNFGGGATDAFLVKFNDGGVRQWSTYYGGSNIDGAFKCTSEGTSVYITGQTGSTTSIATIGSHQTVHNGGGTDAFIAKFNSNGVRLWATYFGGNDSDLAYDCVAGESEIYLTGYTGTQTGLSSSMAHQPYSGGLNDAFLVKLDSSGVLQWSTYYGGTQADIGTSCAMDNVGNVYMVGNTRSSNGISTSGSHQVAIGSTNESDVFLAKFNESGVRQWGTYYGGTGPDGVNSCASSGVFIYISGIAHSSSGITSANTYQSTYGGDGDAFMAQFDTNGIRQWATYYGGAGVDVSSSCAPLSSSFYCSGSTFSTSNISTSAGHQVNHGGGGWDGFIAKFCIPNDSVIYANECDSYTWVANNVTYFTSGTHIDTLENTGGCDSVVTLNLIIRESTGAVTTASSCKSYRWDANSQFYTSSGTYLDTLTNVNGCDSILTLNLTIYSVDTSISIMLPVLTSNATLASYQWLLCLADSFQVLSGDTTQSITVSNNGNYAVAVTYEGCTDTSSCRGIFNLGGPAWNYETMHFRAWPNPTSGQLYMRFEEPEKIIKAQVINVIGHSFECSLTSQDELSVLTILAPQGVYSIELKLDSGKCLRFQIVKT